MSKQERIPIKLDTIYSPEETVRLYEEYRALAGDKLMATLIEANNVLTVAGARPQTEFYLDEPNEETKITVGRLNARAIETGVFFEYDEEFDTPRGKRMAMVNILNLKSLDKLTQKPPVPEIPRYDSTTGVEGFYSWARNAVDAVTQGVTGGKSEDAATILTGFTKGYPWIASLDCATFPPGYGDHEEELGVATVKIPHTQLYGGPSPEFDVKKAHLSHPDVVKIQQQWEEFLKQFYDSQWHKDLRTSVEFTGERNEMRESSIEE